MVGPRTALIVVDMQNDFIPGVSISKLPVDGGDQILSPINALMHEGYQAIVATQDWHPAGHESFASAGKGGPWPEHCISGSWGAQLDPFLDTRKVNMILRKGTNPVVDSYSAFRENDKKTTTGLASWLWSRGIRNVEVCGLALDYCVDWTCTDALFEGFNVSLHVELTRPVFRAKREEILQRLSSKGGDDPMKVNGAKYGVGNQYHSRRGELIAMLHLARDLLSDGYGRVAREILDLFWRHHAQAPASTRRRWKCGR